MPIQIMRDKSHYDYSKGADRQSFSVHDGNLITGQNPGCEPWHKAPASEDVCYSPKCVFRDYPGENTANKTKLPLPTPENPTDSQQLSYSNYGHILILLRSKAIYTLTLDQECFTFKKEI